MELFLVKSRHCFGQVPHNLRLQILDLVENGERPVLEDRVSVYGQDSSFHNSQIGVKAYSRNLAGGHLPSAASSLSTLPGAVARQNAPGQPRAPSENEPSPRPEGHLPPYFQPAFRRRFSPLEPLPPPLPFPASFPPPPPTQHRPHPPNFI